MLSAFFFKKYELTGKVMKIPGLEKKRNEK